MLRGNRRGIALHHIIYGIIAIAVVVFVLARVLGKGTETEANPDPRLIDPAPYRADIQQVETLLYGNTAPGLSDVERLSQRAMVLATRLMGGANKLQASLAFRRVTGFSGRIKQQVGQATFDRAAAQHDWEAVRDSVFRPAPWFHGGSH